MADAASTQKQTSAGVTGVLQVEVPLALEAQQGASDAFMDVSQAGKNAATGLMPVVEHRSEQPSLFWKQ